MLCGVAIKGKVVLDSASPQAAQPGKDSSSPPEMAFFCSGPDHSMYFKVDALTANMYPGAMIGYHRLR